MKTHPATRALSALTLVALAACSGGGTPSTPVVTASTTPVTSNSQGAVSITFRFPQYAATSATTRKPAYLSYGTKSAIVTVAVNGGTPMQIAQIAQINPTTPGCATNGADIVCTTTALAPVGSDVFSATTYDAVQSPNSNPVGHVLSVLSNFPVTVVAGQTTPVRLTLGGAVATGTLQLPNPSPGPTAVSEVLELLTYDAAGYLIVGPYSQTVTLSDSDTGTTNLSNGGAPGTKTITTANSGDTLYLNYSGAPITGGSATISATTPATTSPTAITPTIASVGFTPTTNANTPSQLIAIGGYNNSNAGVRRMYVMDLGSATGTTTAMTVANYLYTVADTQNVSLGLGNQIIGTDPNGNGLDYWTLQPIPNPVLPTPPDHPTPVSALTTGVNGTGYILSNGDIFGEGQVQTSVESVFSPLGESGAVSPSRTFSFSKYMDGGLELDPSGNFWTNCIPSLCEYAKNDVDTATGGAVINPISTINVGTAPGQLVFEGSAYQIAFDAQSNLYVLSDSGNKNQVTVFSAASIANLGASSNGPVALESFNAVSTTGGTSFTKIGVDPATGYIVLSDGATTLQYFLGLKNTPPQGGNQTAFRATTLPAGNTFPGSFYYLH